MSGVFRDYDLKWGGKTYTFTPSMRFIRMLERGDGTGPLSVIGIMTSALAGSPQVGLMSWLVTMALNEAGADVDEIDVYSGLMGGEEEASNAYRDVIASLSPSESADTKKDDAPAE